MENREKAPESVQQMIDRDLIEWLGIPQNSLQPELYIHRLPTGIEYISPPVALNCLDYAQGSRGLHTLYIPDLIPAPLAQGNMIVYFQDSDEMHAGIVIERGARVISQWGSGAIFKHGIFQIPRGYGNRYQCFLSR